MIKEIEMEKVLNFDENKLGFSEVKDFLSSNGRHATTLMHGEVEIRNQFGRLLQKKSNIILLGGRRFVLEKLFNVEIPSKRITINEKVLGINTDENKAENQTGPNQEKCVCLWGVGKGGSELEYGAVKVPAEKEYNLYDMIPMRYVSKDNDLSDDEKSKYYLRREEGDYVAYYLKTFESSPSLKIKIGEEDYVPNLESDNLPTNWDELIDRKDVDCYIELNLKLSADDVREYFIEKETGGLSMARINELGTFLGCKLDGANGDYKEVECFSKLCFNNEPLDDETKELIITYKFYV
jgi:hypothetical protein